MQRFIKRTVREQAQAIETLSRELERVSAPTSPSLTEVTSLRGAGQLLTLEIARAKDRVDLCAPAESYRMVGPALRRTLQSGVTLSLWSDEALTGEVAAIQRIEPADWPAMAARLREFYAAVGDLDALDWDGAEPEFVYDASWEEAK